MDLVQTIVKTAQGDYIAFVENPEQEKHHIGMKNNQQTKEEGGSTFTPNHINDSLMERVTQLLGESESTTETYTASSDLETNGEMEKESSVVSTHEELTTITPQENIEQSVPTLQQDDTLASNFDYSDTIDEESNPNFTEPPRTTYTDIEEHASSDSTVSSSTTAKEAYTFTSRPFRYSLLNRRPSNPLQELLNRRTALFKTSTTEIITTESTTTEGLPTTTEKPTVSIVEEDPNRITVSQPSKIVETPVIASTVLTVATNPIVYIEEPHVQNEEPVNDEPQLNLADQFEMLDKQEAKPANAGASTGWNDKKKVDDYAILDSIKNLISSSREPLTTETPTDAALFTQEDNVESEDNIVQPQYEYYDDHHYTYQPNDDNSTAYYDEYYEYEHDVNNTDYPYSTDTVYYDGPQEHPTEFDKEESESEELTILTDGFYYPDAVKDPKIPKDAHISKVSPTDHDVKVATGFYVKDTQKKGESNYGPTDIEINQVRTDRKNALDPHENSDLQEVTIDNDNLNAAPVTLLVRENPNQISAGNQDTFDISVSSSLYAGNFRPPRPTGEVFSVDLDRDNTVGSPRIENNPIVEYDLEPNTNVVNGVPTNEKEEISHDLGVGVGIIVPVDIDTSERQPSHAIDEDQTLHLNDNEEVIIPVEDEVPINANSELTTPDIPQSTPPLPVTSTPISLLNRLFSLFTAPERPNKKKPQRPFRQRPPPLHALDDNDENVGSVPDLPPRRPMRPPPNRPLRPEAPYPPFRPSGFRPPPVFTPPGLPQTEGVNEKLHIEEKEGNDLLHSDDSVIDPASYAPINPPWSLRPQRPRPFLPQPSGTNLIPPPPPPPPVFEETKETFIPNVVDKNELLTTAVIPLDTDTAAVESDDVVTVPEEYDGMTEIIDTIDGGSTTVTHTSTRPTTEREKPVEVFVPSLEDNLQFVPEAHVIDGSALPDATTRSPTTKFTTTTTTIATTTDEILRPSLHDIKSNVEKYANTRFSQEDILPTNTKIPVTEEIEDVDYQNVKASIDQQNKDTIMLDNSGDNSEITSSSIHLESEPSHDYFHETFVDSSSFNDEVDPIISPGFISETELEEKEASVLPSSTTTTTTTTRTTTTTMPTTVKTTSSPLIPEAPETSPTFVISPPTTKQPSLVPNIQANNKVDQVLPLLVPVHEDDIPSQPLRDVSTSSPPAPIDDIVLPISISSLDEKINKIIEDNPAPGPSGSTPHPYHDLPDGSFVSNPNYENINTIHRPTHRDPPTEVLPAPRPPPVRPPLPSPDARPPYIDQQNRVTGVNKFTRFPARPPPSFAQQPPAVFPEHRFHGDRPDQREHEQPNILGPDFEDSRPQLPPSLPNVQ